jgi:hypothetical protein
MSKQTTEAREMVARMRPLLKPILAGHDPSVQSIVLADLLATWIAGHHPGLRATMLAAHDDLVRDLIPHNEKEIFGDAGHPGWRDVEGGKPDAR